MKNRLNFISTYINCKTEIYSVDFEGERFCIISVYDNVGNILINFVRDEGGNEVTDGVLIEEIEKFVESVWDKKIKNFSYNKVILT